MKKILILTTLTIVLIACNSSEKNQSIDSIIASKDPKALTAKKAELQLQLTQLDEALAALDIKKEVEAYKNIPEEKIVFERMAGLTN